MRSHLKDLAANPNLIPGIYNYCDRWCEHCAFTGQCLVYATIEADASTEELSTHDLQSALFWKRLADVFEETRAMIMEWADEQGVDLAEVQLDLSSEDRDQRLRDTNCDATVLAAKGYALDTFNFFGPAATPRMHEFEVETDADELDVGAAIDVIKHYQFFIAAKVLRALLAVGVDFGNSAVPEMFVSDEFNFEGCDADGSAKIALIAIDRSQAAWNVLRRHLPQDSHQIESFIVSLERVKNMVESAFPKARGFMRPGFDLFVSEFTN
jgi:glutaredoxin